MEQHTIITGPNVQAFRLLALKNALKLEIMGMKRRLRPSAYAIIKREFKFKGGKKAVFDKFVKHLQLQKILVTND